MQVRDLMEKLAAFDPKSSVEFDVNIRRRYEYPITTGSFVRLEPIKECEIERGPDTAIIIVSER